ncbi:hypothetical protein RIF29_35243 [Crotalaria pallida]|uniref:Homeobox domain-containing protein n=1 Tax=Crotalaria pallida TaxID=3830 RepID=A0AAN9E9Y3_CROPI
MEYSSCGSSSSQKRNYQRNTPSQFQALESIFKENPRPNPKQRMQLSRELGLTPTQVQHDRADNCMLRAENDRMRSENIALNEKLKNCICPKCGPHGGDSYFDHQGMKLENMYLKEEIDKVSSIIAKFIGRPQR